MSNSEIDQDGFRRVKYKRNSKNKQTKTILPTRIKDQEEPDIDVDKVIK